MRGYTLIEPEIHKKLNWDFDLIVRCLEVIRLQLPQIISKGMVGIEYDLIAVGNPHGPPYPAIGLYCDFEAEQKFNHDWCEMDERTNHWIQQTGLEFLIKEASTIDYIDWDKLTVMRTFPERN